MRLSTLVVGFVCAVSLAFAGLARAQTPKDVVVTNDVAVHVTNDATVHLSATGVAAVAGAVEDGVTASTLSVDVVNTDAIPVDVGGPLQVEGPDDPLGATPIRVQADSVFSVPFNREATVSPTSTTPIQTFHFTIPDGSFVVVTSVSAIATSDDGVQVFVQWEDGFGGGTRRIPLPMQQQGSSDFASAGYEQVHFVAQGALSVQAILLFPGVNPANATIFITGYLIDAP